MGKSVLIVDNSKFYTGAFKALTFYINSLEDHHFHLCLDKNFAKTVQIHNTEIYPFRFVEINKSVKSLFLYIPFLIINVVKLLQIIKREQIKVIHINDMYNLSGVMLKILKRKQVKLIYHARLLPSSYIGPFYPVLKKCITSFADQIICVSARVKEHWPSDKAIVIYDSLPLTFPDNFVKTFDHTVCRIIYFGNYISGKGYIHLIKMIPFLIEHFNAQFHISCFGKVADANFFEHLKKEAQPFKKWIAFNSFSKTLEDKYLSADLTLNLSVSESFSMTCYESLLYKTPVLAYDSGGLREMIRDNENGFLFKTYDYGQIAQKAAELFNDKEKLKLFSENARKNLIMQFSSAKTIQQIKKVYTY